MASCYTLDVGQSIDLIYESLASSMVSTASLDAVSNRITNLFIAGPLRIPGHKCFHVSEVLMGLSQVLG